MKVKELIGYLQRFDQDENVSALILKLETREAYKVSYYQLMEDVGFPVLLFELGEASAIDDIVEEVEYESKALES